MKIDILTVFPEMFVNFLDTSIIKKAIIRHKVSISVHNIRKYSHNKHHKVDDTPYGGGEGMVMAFPPLYDALMALKSKDSVIILLSPQGKVFKQQTARRLAKNKHLIFICGHYEGVDARVLDYVDFELSIGDFILTGGELAAMVIADAVVRLIPGVILEDSVKNDSLENHLLKYPQYTKPENYLGHQVPEVLLSGHHENIQKWRNEQALSQTYHKRKDLYNKAKRIKAVQALMEKISKNTK